MPSSKSHAARMSWLSAQTVASLCGAASLLIAFGCLAERNLKKSYPGWIFFVVAMTLLFVTVSATCPYFYATVYADILREWP